MFARPLSARILVPSLPNPGSQYVQLGPGTMESGHAEIANKIYEEPSGMSIAALCPIPSTCAVLERSQDSEIASFPRWPRRSVQCVLLLVLYWDQRTRGIATGEILGENAAGRCLQARGSGCGAGSGDRAIDRRSLHDDFCRLVTRKL